MILRLSAFLGLACLAFLAACGPLAQQVTETPAVAPTELPPSTPSPTETPRPSDTPIPTATGDPAATPSGQADPGAGQPTSAGQPAGGKAPEQYTFLGQSIPDRTQFLPNRVVTITWTIQNSGAVGWTKDYRLRYFSGPSPDKSEYLFTKDVPANDTINLTVTFTTPASPGDYDLWFKLTNSAGQNFGDLDLVFTVSSSPSAGTSTASP